MNKIVSVDVNYLGRLIRSGSSTGDFKFKFYVTDDPASWEKKTGWREVYFPVELDSKGQEYKETLDASQKPLTAGSAERPNGRVYQTLEQLPKPVEIKVDKNAKYYKIVADCTSCIRMYPERRDTEDEGMFVVASGSIGDMN